MIKPNNDRLDYGKLLTPPDDYSLDFAIGTTYSLDLDALVGASLSLGLSIETDNELSKSPVFLLEALRRTGDRIALFCQNGQIHYPNRITPLYILLEKIVFPIKLAEKDNVRFPSFHPKFWLIRYKNKMGEKKYRFIILSRNLTFDRSWDITYKMDGEPSDKKSDKNTPLCDFLEYLSSWLPDKDGNKYKLITSLQNELETVNFSIDKTDKKIFKDFEFLPTGFTSSSGKEYSIKDSGLFKRKFSNLLIMSPFLSGSTVGDFNKKLVTDNTEEKAYLFTRESSLTSLSPEQVSNFEIYTLKDEVIDGESRISDNNEKSSNYKQQDIHAKFYLLEKDKTSDFYLGSLNASHNAVYSNVEFLIKLKAPKEHLDINMIKKDLLGEEDSPFCKIELRQKADIEDDETQNSINLVINEICSSIINARVTTSNNNLYDLTVNFKDCNLKNCEVILKPLLAPNQQAVFSPRIIFKNLSSLELSEFYELSVSLNGTSVKRVIKIKTLDLPSERESQVVNSIIADRDCFYSYVSFLLDEESYIGDIDDLVGDNIKNINKYHNSSLEPSLYEKMLQTAFYSKEKLKEIDYIMSTVSKDGVVPDDFKRLCETFKKALNID